jgi:hypothetical protein
MGSVLAQQQEGGDREKGEQNRARSHVEPATRSRCFFRVHVGLRQSPIVRYLLESALRAHSPQLAAG